MTTAPFASKALSVEDTDPSCAVNSLTRSCPPRNASMTATCLTAFARGVNSENAGPATTQRSSTWPTEGCSSRQRPSRPCTMRGTPPGGVNRRTQADSGAI